MVDRKIIELFLVNEMADYLFTGELSDWNYEALKILEIEVFDYDREDIERPGVYFIL